MIKFKVATNELLAASVFSSDDESRLVLNGVLIELRPNAQPVIVSTDGRRLCVIESQVEQSEVAHTVEAATNLILSTEALKCITKFDKGLGKEIGGHLQIEYRPSERILVQFAGGKIETDWEEGALIEGDYPAWRQVIPTGEKKEVPDFSVNAEYLSDFVKAAKHLDVEPLLSLNLFTRESAFEIKISGAPYFYSVLMPAKPSEQTNWKPEFLGMPEPTNKAA